jgi:uncharacterized protein (TIGR02246 family)
MEGIYMSEFVEQAHSLYRKLLNSWNTRDAEAMAALFAEDGESIGYDGSEVVGKREIASHLKPIFDHHETAVYVNKVKDVRLLGTDVFVLRAIAGMFPPGKSDIEPSVNAHQTVVAENRDGEWQIVLFQNTPAQYHGRPEMIEKMTEELREQLYEDF